MSPPGGTCLCPGGILTRCLSYLIWLHLMWGSSGSILNPFWMTELLTSKGTPSRPAKETHFSCLYLGSHSFGRCPQLATIGESRNVDQPVNRELCLSAQLFLYHYRAIQSIRQIQIRLSISRSFIPSLVNETLRYIIPPLGEGSHPWSGERAHHPLPQHCKWDAHSNTKWWGYAAHLSLLISFPASELHGKFFTTQLSILVPIQV